MTSSIKKRRPSQTSSLSSNTCNDHHRLRRKSITKTKSTLEETTTSTRRTSLVAAMSLFSLPSFNEHMSQFMNVLDVFDSYKKKMNQSTKKLESFFGEPIPVDICLCEIKREGLKAILESKLPLSYFLYYLLNEYNSENLFFFLEVEKFENHPHQSLKAAEKIYDTFISINSPLELNLDEKVKRDILKCIQTKSLQDIFSEAKSTIYFLLESSFHQFLNTSLFAGLINDCGEFNIHYDDHLKRKAVHQLSKYLAQQHIKNSLYYKSIHHLLKKFVKYSFGINYVSIL